MKAAVIFCLLFVNAALGQQAQGTLTNQRIGDMALAGVSQSEIIRVISTAASVSFDLRPNSTDALLQVGVSEDIIKAMAAREMVAAPSASGAIQATPDRVSVTGPAPLNVARSKIATGPAPASITEVGAYFQQSGQWVEMMHEVVNWKTGGVMKSLSTAFIVKGDVNGRLRRGKSKTPLAQPIQLLIYSPEGTQVTEYQLIRLRSHSNSREFRTVTGGVFHVSGDSNRDDLPFDSQHVAARTWTISLAGLKPGEYGLLPPGLAQSLHRLESFAFLLRSK
jgi:hypothetical protein